MGKRDKKGSRPTASSGAAALPTASPAPGSTGTEYPKFSLQFLQRGFGVHELNQEQQAAFARTLQERSCLTWNEIIRAPKQGQGIETMPPSAIKPPIPTPFSDVDKFVVFRYCGKLPMVGARVGEVFYVLWIERQFGEVYDHGGS